MCPMGLGGCQMMIYNWVLSFSSSHGEGELLESNGLIFVVCLLSEFYLLLVLLLRGS